MVFSACRSYDSRNKHEIIRCLKAFMNNKVRVSRSYPTPIAAPDLSLLLADSKKDLRI